MDNHKTLLQTAIVSLSLSITGIALAQQAPADDQSAPTNIQQPSDAVGTAAPTLQGLEYIQGEPVNPELNTEGEVYLLELWATWCGPCIASMPHIRDLHNRYAEHGLRVVGMNVFEDNKPLVEEFIAENDDFSFRIALTGDRSSAFASDYLEAFAIRGIPQTILVKDGVIQSITHPNQVTNELIERLLDEDFNADEFQNDSEERNALIDAARQIRRHNRWEDAFAIIEPLREHSPSLATEINIEANAYMNNGDAVMEIYQDLDQEHHEHFFIKTNQFLDNGDTIDSIAPDAAAYFHENLDADDTTPQEFVTYLAYLRSCLLADVDQETYNHMREVLNNGLYTEAFDEYLHPSRTSIIRTLVEEALESGEMGSVKELLYTVRDRARSGR